MEAAYCPVCMGITRHFPECPEWQPDSGYLRDNYEEDDDQEELLIVGQEDMTDPDFWDRLGDQD